jgi:phenylpropionate dioxygenase-like ring-hydroxylating dioxygenase large terminal subunit
MKKTSDEMQNSKGIERQLLDRIKLCKLPPLQRRSLPFECYWEDSILIQEQKLIFSNQWLGLGRADRLGTPGEYEAFELCGQALVLIRDQDKILRLYANTCRHRGAKLLDGAGQCQAISCPFHGWTYTLDGNLKYAKTMSENPNFDFSEHSLIEYKLKELQGFLFAFLGSQPTDLDTQLGDFSELHQPWSLNELITTRRVVFEVQCNWKAFLDVFNEYYHLNNIHPTSIDNLYSKPEESDKTTGDYASQFGFTTGTGALLEAHQSNALPKMENLEAPWSLGARYSWIFPNMTFAASQEAIWVYEANPITSESCQVRQSICFPKNTIELPDFKEKSQVYYQRLDDALDEDIAALENQQKGLNKSPSLQGQFSTLMEANVVTFAQWYANNIV